jgi:N6-adenosine-specific RNA methylase IME4
MIDPPWLFQNWSAKGEEKSAKRHYDCMPTPEIAALPVGHLAGRDCWLWLWATWAMLPDAMQVMDAWGFRYVTGGPWVKRGASGKLAFGTGYIMRECNEVFLLGKVGEPPTCSNSIRNLIEAPRRQHSRKPDLAYSTCEELFGPARRADLFSRQSRPGWESWGKEASKFDPGAAPASPGAIPSTNPPAPATAPLLELCGG